MDRKLTQRGNAMKAWVVSIFPIMVSAVFLTPLVCHAQAAPKRWVEPPPAAPLPLPEQGPRQPHPQKRQQPSPPQGKLKLLRQYTEKLRQEPADRNVREKTIALALSMKPSPPTPEEAERHIVRGIAFLKKGSDPAEYRKAILELEEAISIAPWNAAAYYRLGEAQEKSGLYAEAIKSLKLSLLAAPNAKNARAVKNRIYAIEVDMEVATSKHARPGAESASPTPPPFTEHEKKLPIIKVTAHNRAPLSLFEGAWYYQETLRGESSAIHAFTIGKTPDGDLVAMPPRRGADSVAAVPVFEISGRNLKISFQWKVTSEAVYWKTEQYDLAFLEDGKTLSGSYSLKTSKGKNAYLDMVLFRK